MSPLFFFNDNRCNQSSISQCSVSPFIYLMMFSVPTPFLFFKDNQCLHSYVQCLHSSISRCLYAKHLSPYLYFMNCSVSIPLFHDVQCLHSSISRCSVFPLLFYDNLCFTISSISIPIHDVSMSKNSSVGRKTQNKHRNIFSRKLGYLFLRFMIILFTSSFRRWPVFPFQYFTMTKLSTPLFYN